MTPKQKGWVYVAVQFLLGILIIVSGFIEKKYMMHLHSYIFDLLAFLFLSSGALMLMISLMNFGQMVTPNPVPVETYTLKRNGMYSKVRHPIYLSALTIMLGCVCFFSSYSSLFFFIILVAFLIRKMNFEEKYLKEKFPKYEEYCKTTKRLIPGLY